MDGQTDKTHAVQVDKFYVC